VIAPIQVESKDVKFNKKVVKKAPQDSQTSIPNNTALPKKKRTPFCKQSTYILDTGDFDVPKTSTSQ